ncbi:MAG: DUF2927 domain-containing protein [Calditrichia bacterium]
MKKTAHRLSIHFLSAQLLILLVLCSCASTSSPRRQVEPPVEPIVYKVASYTKEKRLTLQSQYFLDIALGAEYSIGDFRIKKWVDNLKIEIVGQPTHADRAELNNVISELNELLDGKLSLEIVATGGNVEVLFIPHDRFYEYEPSGLVFTNGFFWNWWNYAGEIYRGRVVVASDRLTQSHRNHLIREELTQLLGLMNDSQKYPESIFFQGHTEINTYCDFDRQVIRMLYDTSLPAGTLDFEVREWVHSQN